jgi:hypothetical protein
MQKPGQDVCGCCGSGPLRELQLLAWRLERRQAQQAERDKAPEARRDAIPASSACGRNASTCVRPPPDSIATGGTSPQRNS